MQVDHADRETRDRHGSTADWSATQPISEEYPHYIKEKPLAASTTSSEKRRSSTDFDFLDLANFRPQLNTVNLDSISEQQENRVFDSEIEELDMPPQVNHSLEDALKKFKRGQHSWSHNYQRLKYETGISKGDLYEKL